MVGWLARVAGLVFCYHSSSNLEIEVGNYVVGLDVFWTWVVLKVWHSHFILLRKCLNSLISQAAIRLGSHRGNDLLSFSLLLPCSSCSSSAMQLVFPSCRKCRNIIPLIVFIAVRTFYGLDMFKQDSWLARSSALYSSISVSRNPHDSNIEPITSIGQTAQALFYYCLWVDEGHTVSSL